MSKHSLKANNKIQAEVILALCRSRPGYKALCAFATWESLQVFREHVRCLLEAGERLDRAGITIVFPNGSRIFFDNPKTFTGWSVHDVYIDEADKMEPEMVEHLMMRNRLK